MEVSKEIQELALKFVESEEMRECFRNTLFVGNISTRLRFDPERDCREFIVGSRSGIDDKLAALRKLPPSKETSCLINVAESVLAELKASKDNVFLTTVHYPDDTGNMDASDTWDDRKPFLSFESVRKYVKEQTARECEYNEESLEQCMERVWYEVEKFIPDEANELKHRITWILNAKGEIMFFELGKYFDDLYYSSLHSDEYWAWWDWKGELLRHPPVPFDFGDIITIDMRPFCKDLRGVIVHIGDNCDSCAIWCIHCDGDGYLYCSALKHNMDNYYAKVSPLYRAERFKGELPEKEQALGIISEAIKRMPSFEETDENGYFWRGHKLAERFMDFIHDECHKQRGRRLGCSWDEFRKKFGI